MIKILFIISVFFINSCSTASGDLFSVVKNQIVGFSEPFITDKDIEVSKYSFMILRSGRGPYIRLVLNSYSNNTYEWISADNQKIYIYKGLIVKTINLEHDFEIINYLDYDPLLVGDQFFSINFKNPRLFDAKLKIGTELTDESSENTNFGSMKKYLLNKEIASIGWRSKNVFWIDQEGNVLISSQEIHPFSKKIEYKVYLK